MKKSELIKLVEEVLNELDNLELYVREFGKKVEKIQTKLEDIPEDAGEIEDDDETPG